MEQTSTYKLIFLYILLDKPKMLLRPSPFPSISPLPRSLKVSAATQSPLPPKKTGVTIIGGGLSGLAAATHLQADNIPFVLLEASDNLGGRVASDKVNGFIFDRGFQIFITAYPEAQKLLDYNNLHLNKFYSGAKVFYNGGFHTVADPIRHFPDAISSLINPIGSVFDKVLVGLTRLRALTLTDEVILTGDEIKTVDFLRGVGFSDAMVERFFKPFFGGVFFDRELETTSRLFDFVFKCLALGDNALPAGGICAIPEQLAGKLPEGSILLKARVVEIDVEGGDGFAVRLESGEVVKSELGVIVAVEEFEAAKLLAGNVGGGIRVKKPVRSTVCLYFSANLDMIPVKDPVLFLNGSGKGIVNNMFFATNVVRTYAPPGKGLISVSLIGLFDDVEEGELVERVVKELEGWFGERVVRAWEYMRMYKVGFAQPNQCPPTDLMKDPRVKPGLYVCGDYVTNATFDGALVSGRRAVEALIKERVRVDS
ncbi:oxidase [Lithospermum erythrorhizon]|uniref:Oxidase n=1 Tax=Lithospermum erythrorhizon TaxID=34254 RepID=A0AAV3NPP9_LITER